MSRWVITGMRTGIRTTSYPHAPEGAAGVSPGRPGGAVFTADAAASTVSRCPTEALLADGGRVDVDYRRCVHCYRCTRGAAHPLPWQDDYEWAGLGASSGAPDGDGGGALGAAFRRSVHVLVVDAGDCGACLNEVKLLNNPYYNMHRLGFFVTPTPRHADVLLVVGPVTDHMRLPLQEIHAAMPAPKRVIAVGACALSGGVFADSFVCAGGVAEVIPVDVAVPGNPPPPLAILHALLVATGRKPPVSLDSCAGDGPTVPMDPAGRSEP